jgi:hypothetical protein
MPREEEMVQWEDTRLLLAEEDRQPGEVGIHSARVGGMHLVAFPTLSLQPHGVCEDNRAGEYARRKERSEGRRENGTFVWVSHVLVIC